MSDDASLEAPVASDQAVWGDVSNFTYLNNFPLTFTTQALCGNVWVDVDLSKGPVYWTANTGWYTIGSDGLLAQEPEPQATAEQLEADDFRAAQRAPWSLPQLIAAAEADVGSRSDWLAAYSAGLDLLGLKVDRNLYADEPAPIDYFAITRDVSA